MQLFPNRKELPVGNPEGVTMVGPSAQMRLCDDDGIVRSGAMHHGTDYVCTGSAHFDGASIRCTNPAHDLQGVSMRPSVGRIVHYVSYGTPGGEYKSECRAAIVTSLGEMLPYPTHGDGVDDLREDDAQLVDLCVMNPTGLFFNQGVPQDERPAHEREHGGTWHWPERVEE